MSYKKAIALLVEMNENEKAKLAVELAKHHPSIFVKLVESKRKEEEVMLDINIVFIISALNTDRRVDAIKGIRYHLGHDLSETLDIVRVYDGDKDIFLSPAQTATLNNLKRVAKVLKV